MLHVPRMTILEDGARDKKKKKKQEEEKEDTPSHGGFGSKDSFQSTGHIGEKTTQKSQEDRIDEILQLTEQLSQEKNTAGLQLRMERSLQGISPDALRETRDAMLDQADALTEALMNQDVGDAAKTAEIAQLKKNAENLGRLIPKAENLSRGLPANYSSWDRAVDRIGRGAGQFNSGIASSVDFLANLLPRVEGALTGEASGGTFLGQLLKPITGATGMAKDYTQTVTGNIDRRVQAADGDSRGQKFVSDLTSGVTAALPNAILALMTGGGSAAAQLEAQGAGILNTARTAITNMAQNPLYWTSAAQTLGPSYDEAIASGATETEAILATVLSTGFNSAVEVGGTEALPGELRGMDLSTAEKAWKWVHTALEEGREEMVQGVLERLTNKAVFDHSKPFVSWEDESAVFNPKVSAWEGAMGTAVGMTLGGGQVAADTLWRMGSSRPLPFRAMEQSQPESGIYGDSAVESQAAGTASGQAGGLTVSSEGTQGTGRQPGYVQKNAPVRQADAAEQMQTEAESTRVNTDPARHTPQEQAVVEEYQGAVDPAIVSFISKWKGLQNENYKRKIKMTVADVTSKTVADVKRLIGLDVSDYTHVLSGNAMRHIERRHGANGEADHSMANVNDIARIGYVLENYDTVEMMYDKDGKGKTSRDNLNADNTNAPLITFKKKVDGTYYVVEAVPDSTARQMRIISAYMESGSTDQVLNMPQAASSQTSETLHGANTPTLNLAQNDTGVNGKLLDLRELPAETLRVCLDAAVDGDRRELNAALDMYVRNGLTPEAAGVKTIQDMLKRCRGVFEGDVRRGLSAVTPQMIQRAVEQDRLNCIVAGENVRYNGMEQMLLEAALELPADSEARNLADIYTEQYQTAVLQGLDEAASFSRRGGAVETEAQLQELALKIGQQEFALEQLAEGNSIARYLTSEQLGRLALAMQEERSGNAQSFLPTEEMPILGANQEMQRLQLAWKNGAGKLTEGRSDGKVNKKDRHSNKKFEDVLFDGYVDKMRLVKEPIAFANVSIEEMAGFLQSIGYQVTIMEASRSRSGAKKIVIGNANHTMNIKQVQFSPGGGSHGLNPYMKFSTNGHGIIKIVFGDPKTYISRGEKAEVIFAEEDNYD